jgi:hypothetical protein
LYVFGKALSEFSQKNGVYNVVIDLQYLVDNYTKASGIGTSVEAKNAEVNNMLLAWKSTDWSARNYVFTISNVAVKPAPQFSMDFETGKTDVIEVGATTALKVTTNLDGEIEWWSSDESVATVANGVVTGVKGGTVTITASLDGTAVSKTVYVVGNALSSNQLSIISYGYDVSNNAGYFSVNTNNDGDMVVNATFNGDQWWYPALVLRNLDSKEYYEKLYASGYTKLSFNLAIEGEAADWFVFGKALSEFKQTNGVYEVEVDMKVIIDNYATIGGLGAGTEQARPSIYKGQMFLMCQTTDKTITNYSITISNAILKK